MPRKQVKTVKTNKTTTTRAHHHVIAPNCRCRFFEKNNKESFPWVGIKPKINF